MTDPGEGGEGNEDPLKAATTTTTTTTTRRNQHLSPVLMPSSSSSSQLSPHSCGNINIETIPEEENDESERDGDLEEEKTASSQTTLMLPLLSEDSQASLSSPPRRTTLSLEFKPRTSRTVQKSLGAVGSSMSMSPTSPPLPSLSLRQQQQRQRRQQQQQSVNRTSVLTLESVMSHTPFETEAEAYIQRSLDAQAQEMYSTSSPYTTGGAPQQQRQQRQSLLLPDDFSIETFRSKHTSKSPSKNAQQLPLFGAPGHHQRQGASTAEDLYHLTLGMKLLEEGQAATVVVGQVEDSSYYYETDGAALATNGVQILQQQQQQQQQQKKNRFTKSIMKPPLAPRATTTTTKTSLQQHNQSIHSALDSRDEFMLKSRMTHLKDLAHQQQFNPRGAVIEKVPDHLPAIVSGSGGGGGGGSNIKSTKEEDDDMEQSSSSSSSGSDTDDDDNNNNIEGRQNSAGKQQQQQQRVMTVSEYQKFDDWFKVKRMGVWHFFSNAVLYAILPSTAIAAILFYGAGNPPCNRKGNNCVPDDADVLLYLSSASASWWLLFLCCRQVITLTLALITEDVVVDYLALRTQWSVRLCGPLFTLFIVQSKGWPSILFFWGVFDLCLLFGPGQFARHWLFYQPWVGLFNGANPSGGIPDSYPYRVLVITATVVSAVVALKRMVLGLVLGKVTFKRYSEELARVMKRAVLVGMIAALGRDIERSGLQFDNSDLPSGTGYSFDDNDKSQDEKTGTEPLSPTRPNMFGHIGSSTQRVAIDELLGAWEEPEAQREADEKPTIGAIIQFRQSTAYLNTPLPFGAAFGSASTRLEVIEATEALYNRLMSSIPKRDVLTFDLLALLAIQKGGELDLDLLKQLVRLFRPDREGNLSLLDFAKSIDTCYKEIRLLRANIHNSSKIDHAFEQIVNLVFYLTLVFVWLASIGVDPFTIWLSFTGSFLAFTFIYSTACSNYFQGMLMVFWRRPYEIGDRIATSQPYYDTPSTGSSSWLVKEMDIYSTTVCFGSTSEVATYSNASLSALRIINSSRSPQAYLSFHLRFDINTPYEKLQLFKSGMEKFIKARPREWIRFAAFRCNQVQADVGYIEYNVAAVHRESWDSAATLANSKGDLQAFANELAKKLEMQYTAPPTPVDVTLRNMNNMNAVNIPDPATSHNHPFSDVSPVSVRGEGVGAVRSVAAMFGTELVLSK